MWSTKSDRMACGPSNWQEFWSLPNSVDRMSQFLENELLDVLECAVTTSFV